MLPRKRKMPKRFDKFASHHFYKTPKDLYGRTHFEAYDNVIQGIEKRFQQKDFLIYSNIQDIFSNAINGKDSSQQLKVVCDVFKNDLNPTNLQVQLEQLFQNKPNCSINTLVEVLLTFGRNKCQKMLLPDVVKLARLFLVMPATNASSERVFSGMKKLRRIYAIQQPTIALTTVQQSTYPRTRRRCRQNEHDRNCQGVH